METILWIFGIIFGLALIGGFIQASAEANAPTDRQLNFIDQLAIERDVPKSWDLNPDSKEEASALIERMLKRRRVDDLLRRRVESDVRKARPLGGPAILEKVARSTLSVTIKSRLDSPVNIF